MSWVSLRNITKTLDTKLILNKVNVDIKKGEMLALLGPSGCGKTTILKIIAGLLHADDGEVSIAGNTVTTIPPKNRNAVLVFQNYILFPHMTVEKNIAFGLQAKKIPKERIKHTVSSLIHMIELEGQEKKYPHQLSGGQQQRVAIARALAIDPAILLLDEPFSNLDTRLRETMQSFVKKIHLQTGTTTVLVTHSKEEAFSMCDRVAVMREGKILQVDTAHTLYEKPSSEMVAQCFGETNTLHGHVRNKLAVTVFGEKACDLADGEYTWIIRPEHMHFVQNGVQGKIISTVYMGSHTMYDVRVNTEIFRVLCLSHPQYTAGDILAIDADLEKSVYVRPRT